MRCTSREFDTEYWDFEPDSTSSYTFVGTGRRESSLSFGWNFFYHCDGEADSDSIHDRSCESRPGRLARVFAWRQGWSHFPALRRYNSFFSSLLCTSATNRQRDWRVISLTVLRLSPPLTHLVPFLMTTRPIYREDLITSYSHFVREFRI